MKEGSRDFWRKRFLAWRSHARDSKEIGNVFDYWLDVSRMRQALHRSINEANNN